MSEELRVIGKLGRGTRLDFLDIHKLPEGTISYINRVISDLVGKKVCVTIKEVNEEPAYIVDKNSGNALWDKDYPEEVWDYIKEHKEVPGWYQIED
jgi:hypothetical protein